MQPQDLRLLGGCKSSPSWLENQSDRRTLHRHATLSMILAYQIFPISSFETRRSTRWGLLSNRLKRAGQVDSGSGCPGYYWLLHTNQFVKVLCSSSAASVLLLACPRSYVRFTMYCLMRFARAVIAGLLLYVPWPGQQEGNGNLLLFSIVFDLVPLHYVSRPAYSIPNGYQQQHCCCILRTSFEFKGYSWWNCP
jgi:hypothetical protein